MHEGAEHHVLEQGGGVVQDPKAATDLAGTADTAEEAFLAIFVARHLAILRFAVHAGRVGADACAFAASRSIPPQQDEHLAASGMLA